MSYSRKAFRVLGLLSAVLIVGAIGASAAQAEPGANWMVEGANVTTLLPEIATTIQPLKAGSLEPNATHVELLFKFGGHDYGILCTSVTTPGIKLGANGSVDPGKVKFNGCKFNEIVLSSEGVVKEKKVLSACEPESEGVKGQVNTEEGKGLLSLKGGEAVTVLSPVAGTTLAVVHTGEFCAVGEEVPVGGVLALKEPLGNLEVEALEHDIEEGAGSTLTALGQPAKIDGWAKVKLVGAHNGLNWSGLKP